MDELAPLPAPEAVLNKLKSDGTFDQFRKSCLAAIEAEPSFRAHGEHVEVMSRRYLQNMNWKAGVTTNEARAKLKSYALGVIANPDLQVGMPLGALVEKTLESKGQELLPMIEKAVDTLRAFKPPPRHETSQPSVPVTDSSTTASSSAASMEGTSVDASKRKTSDLGEFSLPIEIPGLTAPKSEKDPVASVASGGDANSTVGKTTSKTLKAKQVESSGSKENPKAVKSPDAPNPVGTSAAGSSSKEEGKSEQQPKEKTSAPGTGKSSTAAKESGKPRPEKEDKQSGGDKDSDKGTSDVGKEMTKAVQKSKRLSKLDVAREKTEAGKMSLRAGNASKEKDKSGESAKECSVGQVKSSNKSTSKVKMEPDFDDNKVSQSATNKETESQHVTDETVDTANSATEVQPQSSQEVPLSGSRKRKQLPPMRRSARLASFTETKDVEDKTAEEGDVKQQDEGNSKVGGKESAAAGGSEADSEVSGHEEGSTKEEHRRVRKRKRKRDGGKAKSVARKKPRILSSSSEEEGDVEAEQMECEPGRCEEDKPSKRQADKRKLAAEGDSETLSEKKGSKKRTLAQSQRDAKSSTPVASSSAKRVKGKAAHDEQGARSKGRSQRLTSPVVVTRYNRRVKPNRRYTPSEDISNSEASDEGGQEPEEEEEKQEGGVAEKKDVEQGLEEISSSEEETEGPSVRARTKIGLSKARK